MRWELAPSGCRAPRVGFPIPNHSPAPPRWFRTGAAFRKPDVHIFGHTHFGWDTVLNGTRYVQDSWAMVAVCASTLVNIKWWNVRVSTDFNLTCRHFWNGIGTILSFWIVWNVIKLTCSPHNHSMAVSLLLGDFGQERAPYELFVSLFPPPKKCKYAVCITSHLLFRRDIWSNVLRRWASTECPPGERIREARSPSRIHVLRGSYEL